MISEDEVGEWLRQGKYGRVSEAAVAEFRQKVFRLACWIFHDEAAAADATQDTFLRIWRSLAAFENRCALSTWVYSIARNTCLNHAGQKAARKEDLFIDRATPRFDGQRRPPAGGAVALSAPGGLPARVGALLPRRAFLRRGGFDSGHAGWYSEDAPAPGETATG